MSMLLIKKYYNSILKIHISIISFNFNLLYILYIFIYNKLNIIKFYNRQPLTGLFIHLYLLIILKL